LIVESPTERRCPAQLILTLPDGSGGGGGNKSTLEAPSVEGTIASDGDLWLFGAIPKECIQIRSESILGHLIRQPNMSVDFYWINLGVQRDVELVFDLGGEKCRREFHT